MGTHNKLLSEKDLAGKDRFGKQLDHQGRISKDRCWQALGLEVEWLSVATNSGQTWPRTGQVLPNSRKSLMHPDPDTKPGPSAELDGPA